MQTNIFNSVLYTISILTVLCIEPKYGIYLSPVAILLIVMEWINTCTKDETIESYSKLHTIASIAYVIVSILVASLLSHGNRLEACILIVTSLLTAICMSNQLVMFAIYIGTKNITIGVTLIYIIKFVASIILSVSIGFIVIQLLPLILVIIA